MYRKFKDCLLKPSRIGQYVDDKTSKTILYFLLILLIYILPQLVNLINLKTMPSSLSDPIITSFSENEQINYKLEKNFETDSNELVSTNDNNKPQYVVVGTLTNVNLDLIILFNEEENPTDLTSYDFDRSLNNHNVLMITFAKKGLYLELGVLQVENNSNNNSNNDIQQQLANQENNASRRFYAYDDLKISEIDFANAHKNKTIFARELNNFYLSIYKKFLPIIIAVGIPMVIISGAISLLIEVLFLALIIKFLYGRFGIKYKTLCKICILAYTPRVVFNLLSIIWSSIIMYLLGQLLTIIYIIIALRYYVIKNIGLKITEAIKNNMDERSDDDEL